SSITDGTHVVVTNLGYAGNAAAGSSVGSGSAVSPGGTQGATGLQGPVGATGAQGPAGTNGTNGTDSFTATSAAFTQPAAGSTVSVTVGTTAWMASGQYVYVANGGYYTVSSITNGTTVVLKNLGYTGNAAAGSSVGSGSAVSPGGIQGATGAAGATGPTGATGAAGTNGANQILFSTGGANLANNSFVGLGAAGAENTVEQIVSASATFTSMRCWVQTAPAANITFTLRVNGANAGLSCTINAGSTSGSGSGSASVSAGDLVDVATPSASTPGKPGTFAVSG